jgi:hypothetical protein
MKYGIYLIREFVSVDKNVEYKPLLQRGLLDICVNLLLSSNDKNILVKNF